MEETKNYDCNDGTIETSVPIDTHESMICVNHGGVKHGTGLLIHWYQTKKGLTNFGIVVGLSLVAYFIVRAYKK